MQELFLGEGICEPITISRLENGKQTPSRSRINALLERLDMPADRYFALLSKKELDVESLQKQITALNVQFAQSRGAERNRIRRSALQAHRELEAMIDKDDLLSRQLILRSRAILGTGDGPYSPDEQRAILTEALRLTSPAFDPDNIGSGLYTTDEIKLINQLAVVHITAGEHQAAISILSQLYDYIRRHFHNIPPTKAHLNMVLYNYAAQLDAVGQYEKAIEIAEEGRRICLDYGHYLSLPGLLEVMAECRHFLGDDEKSRDLYRQAYYLCKAIGDENNLRVIRAEAREYLGLELE